MLEAEASLGDIAASTGAKPRVTTIFEGYVCSDHGAGDFLVRAFACRTGRLHARLSRGNCRCGLGV